MNLASIIVGLGIVVVGLAVSGAIYSCLATWAAWRFLRRPAAAAAGQPSITVLKPLHGDEPELYENLASFCAQVYAGPV
jgi:ceramide glucosyltransferase